MKKQFLLSLMAILLPLTAWAQEKTNIKEAIVEFEYAVYAGTVTEAPNVESVTVNGEELTSSDYEVVGYYTDEKGETSIEKFRHAGTYYAKIKAKDDSEDYEGETIAPFTIDKAQLTLTVGNVSKVYGDSDDKLTPNYSATYQPGDSRNNVKIEGLKVERVKGFEGEDVGSYTITLNYENAVISGDWENDYELLVTSQASLTITPKTLTVDFENLTWIYGETEEKLGNVTVTGNGYAEGEDDDLVQLTWNFTETAKVTKETIRNAGTYPIIASINSKNYTLDPETKISNITINKKELTVSFEEALSKTYGLKDPDFTDLAEVEGLVTEYGDTKENIDLTLTRSNDDENAGSDYTVDTANNDDLTNYTVKEFSEEFTIYQKSLADADITITVAENDKVYQGQAADFELNTITVTYGNKEIDQNKELTNQTDYTFTITEGLKNAGSKVFVTVTAAENGNYTSKNETCTFEIEKAPLTLTVANQTIKFSETQSAIDQIKTDLSQITAGDGQLKGDDKLEDLGITFSLSDEAATGNVNINGYEKGIKIEATSDVANNYEIIYEYGTLTVSAAANRITIGRTTENTAQLLEAYNGYLAASGGFWVDVKDGRTLNYDYWYSMVLPFDITVPDFSNSVGYAVVNVPNEANNDPMAVSFKLTVGTIPANTLFLFKTAKQVDMTTGMSYKLQGTAGRDGTLGDGKNVIKYDPDYYVEDAAGNRYYGVYEKDVTIHDNGYFYLNAGQFKNSGASNNAVSIPILSGYIVAKGGAQARIIVEEADGSTTVINAVNADATTNAEGWYTVGGVKLDGEPTQKGIYINNGKKVVIK